MNTGVTRKHKRPGIELVAICSSDLQTFSIVKRTSRQTEFRLWRSPQISFNLAEISPSRQPLTEPGRTHAQPYAQRICANINFFLFRQTCAQLSRQHAKLSDSGRGLKKKSWKLAASRTRLQDALARPAQRSPPPPHWNGVFAPGASRVAMRCLFHGVPRLPSNARALQHS